MKALFLLLFILSMTIHAHAQIDKDRLFYLQKVEKYRRMKNTGTILTVTGGILFVVGLVTLSNVETTSNGYGQTSTTSGNPAGGAVAFVVGSAGLGAGIPLWIVGSHARDKWQRKLDGVTVGLKINPQGAGLTVRF
jgi:hypothetical protein